jgi:hypothetical protein
VTLLYVHIHIVHNVVRNKFKTYQNKFKTCHQPQKVVIGVNSSRHILTLQIFDLIAVNDATCTWSGPLPPRCQNNSPLSCKIFLGGVPWDISDQILVAAFKPFGNIRIEWPNKDNSSTPKGYLYIIFEHEKQVLYFIQAHIVRTSIMS